MNRLRGLGRRGGDGGRGRQGLGLWREGCLQRSFLGFTGPGAGPGAARPSDAPKPKPTDRGPKGSKGPKGPQGKMPRAKAHQEMYVARARLRGVSQTRVSARMQPKTPPKNTPIRTWRVAGFCGVVRVSGRAWAEGRFGTWIMDRRLVAAASFAVFKPRMRVTEKQQFSPPAPDPGQSASPSCLRR
jgi:hypothetical protein